MSLYIRPRGLSYKKMTSYGEIEKTGEKGKLKKKGGQSSKTMRARRPSFKGLTA